MIYMKYIHPWPRGPMKYQYKRRKNYDSIWSHKL